jgi:protein-disulfide isomerase/uncharacterized membrane protein
MGVADGPENSATSLNFKGIVAAGAAVAVLGFVFSVYSFLHHLELKSQGATNAFCNINATFSCDDVARSAYSEIFGIPLGIFGIGYFLGQIVLLLTSALRSNYRADALNAYRGLCFVGTGASLVLASLSWFVVGKGCLACIGIYLVTFAQVGLVLGLRSDLPSVFGWKSFANGLTFAAIPLGISIGLFNVFRPAPSSFHADVPQGPGTQATEPLALTPTVVPLLVHRSPYSGLGEDYRQGPDDAKVVIVEFADFQCPACRDLHIFMKSLKQEFGDKIQVVYKNYPLDMKCNKALTRKMHEFSCDAALVARCAGQKGKFALAQDLLFARQREINTENIRKVGREIGLSDAEVTECLDSKDLLAKIQDDIVMGDKVGIDGTPTLFINGNKVVGGRSDEHVRSLVIRLLSEAI